MSYWDQAGDFFGKIVDGYVEVETANAEASRPQVPASVGVTEPVTQQANTTSGGVPVSNGSTLDNKTIMMIGGGAFALLLLVVLVK